MQRLKFSPNFVRAPGVFLAAFFLLLSACGAPWNNPYPHDAELDNTLYRSFSLRPKHLDPARSYSADEWIFIQSVYETPLQYHYLKRPYTLIPQIAEKMPTIRFFAADGNEASADDAAFSEYTITIKKGVYYQNHPAFVAENLILADEDLDAIRHLSDFQKTATRELVAADFVHQLKRLANPLLHSPILSLMKDYIVGIDALNERLIAEKSKGYIDLSKYAISGVRVLDRYTYTIRIKGHQPQFLYWLAMPFFTAMPPEADRFYANPRLIEKNIVLDWYPLGTGPFQLTVNNPNREMVLAKNLNFRGENYPASGGDEDVENGLLADAGRSLPFLDKVHFLLEKESTPYWNKFLQGYYDQSGIGSDNFDQAIEVREGGVRALSEFMRGKNIQLFQSDGASIYYTAFNMTDPIVGGAAEKSRKLRQAISIAIDTEEYISIFRNGLGRAAMGPLPPGIFGFEDDHNPVVYENQTGNIRRKNIDQAKILLRAAGYPNGIDPKTGKPLILYFDTAATGSEAQSRLTWIRKQFSKLNISLVIRATSFNRLKDKLRKGQTQIFELGWNADYPDPENFLFLLYGKNAQRDFGGENYANYDNPEFNRLFEKMRNMENSAERLKIIRRMVAILQNDAPWVWGFIPKFYSLAHGWIFNLKPHAMARNTLKYIRIDPQKRAAYRRENNKISWWPLVIFGILGAAFFYRFALRMKK